MSVVRRQLVIALLAGALGVFAGWKANDWWSPPNLPDLVRLDGYKLTNPLLDIDPSRYVGMKEFGFLEQQTSNYIGDQVRTGKIKMAAVYFRDLKNGPWFGVNERENFSPASLLKLPVLMAYLKQAEANPGFLKQEIKFGKGEDVGTEPNFKPEKVLVKGQSYTVEELLTRMITQSDNDALVLLEKGIDGNAIDKVTADLGIVTATDTTPEDYMDVKSYASLYRVLYNSSYLSREMSEKALEILAQTTFKQGLVAGVGDGVVVAHKFGERELPDGVKQLHDCGIVYFPSHPYLLCVMTRGSNYANLASVIQEISRQVFAEMTQRYKG